jgi:hypothetical protein
MPDERKRRNYAKSIDRWNDEGGAPSGGDRSTRREAAERKPAAGKKRLGAAQRTKPSPPLKRLGDRLLCGA